MTTMTKRRRRRFHDRSRPFHRACPFHHRYFDSVAVLCYEDGWNTCIIIIIHHRTSKPFGDHFTGPFHRFLACHDDYDDDDDDDDDERGCQVLRLGGGAVLRGRLEHLHHRGRRRNRVHRRGRARRRPPHRRRTHPGAHAHRYLVTIRVVNGHIPVIRTAIGIIEAAAGTEFIEVAVPDDDRHTGAAHSPVRTTPLSHPNRSRYL
jgi:hypothetical protein